MSQSVEEIAKEITIAMIEKLYFKTPMDSSREDRNEATISVVETAYSRIHETVSKARLKTY